MISDDLVQFLKNNFPRNTGDIRECLELLHEAIEDTMDSISDRVALITKGKQRLFSEAINFLNMAEQVGPILQTIDQYTEKLDLDGEDEPDTQSLADDTKVYKEIPNYSDYLVDTDLVHTLYEGYTNKRPFAFELGDKRVETKNWKDLYLQTCEILVETERDKFLGFVASPRMSGKKMKYFSQTVEEGMRTPRKLQCLDVWVETNFSANHIRNLIVKMLREYDIPVASFKIYLRADYSELHE